MIRYVISTSRVGLVCGCCSSECDTEATAPTEGATTQRQVRTRFICKLQGPQILYADPNAASLLLPALDPLIADHGNLYKVEKESDRK